MEEAKQEEDELENNECKKCKLKASNILGLINHIEDSEKCYNSYGEDGLEVLKETAQIIIDGENGLQRAPKGKLL